MGLPVSVRQFAKLDGCSHTLVAKAVKHGKLPIDGNGMLDSALAGSGWRQSNRRSAEVETGGGNTGGVSTSNVGVETPERKRGRAGANPPPDASVLCDKDFIAEVLAGRYFEVAMAERVKENGLAAKNLLAARKEAGDVVDLEVAEAVLFEQARGFRDAWQNWPSRVAPLIAAKLGIAVEPVLEALNEHVHQQLSDLGEPEADFEDADEG